MALIRILSDSEEGSYSLLFFVRPILAEFSRFQVAILNPTLLGKICLPLANIDDLPLSVPLLSKRHEASKYHLINPKALFLLMIS